MSFEEVMRRQAVQPEKFALLRERLMQDPRFKKRYVLSVRGKLWCSRFKRIDGMMINNGAGDADGISVAYPPDSNCLELALWNHVSDKMINYSKDRYDDMRSFGPNDLESLIVEAVRLYDAAFNADDADDAKDADDADDVDVRTRRMQAYFQGQKDGAAEGETDGFAKDIIDEFCKTSGVSRREAIATFRKKARAADHRFHFDDSIIKDDEYAKHKAIDAGVDVRCVDAYVTGFIDNYKKYLSGYEATVREKWGK